MFAPGKWEQWRETTQQEWPADMQAGTVMRRAFISGLLAASGWILLFTVLPLSLSAKDVGVIIGTLALAEALGATLATGASAQTMMERILLGWIVLCITVFTLFYLDLLTLFAAYPMAGICFLAATLCLALIHYCVATSLPRPVSRALVQARSVVVALGVMAVVTMGSITVAPIMLSAVFALMLILLCVLRAQSGALPQNHLEGHSPLYLLSKNIDLLVIPLFMPSEWVLPYVVAKGGSLVVLVFVQGFERSAAPRVADALALDAAVPFPAVAARLNLGLLLMVGGLAVAVLSVAPMLASLPVLDIAMVRALLLWLLLAEAGPALFGATGLLLQATGFAGMRQALYGIGGCAVLLGSLAGFASNPIALAQLYAAAQTVIYVIGAAVLALRIGVWPGLTALLFRRIRLF